MHENLLQKVFFPPGFKASCISCSAGSGHGKAPKQDAQSIQHMQELGVVTCLEVRGLNDSDIWALCITLASRAAVATSSPGALRLHVVLWALNASDAL